MVNAVVAIVAILGTGGMAVRAVLTLHTTDESAALIVAGDGRATVEAPTPELPTAPIPTAPAPSVPRTTRPAPAVVTVPPTVAPPLTSAEAPTTSVDTTVTPTAPLPPPPNVVRTGPSAWSVVENGLTVTATMVPAWPRVGDTVTVSYTMTGKGDFCCMAFVYVDGDLISQSELPSGPCPVAPAMSGSTTFVVDEAGPLRIQVQGARFAQLCTAPPVFLTASLQATILVWP